MPLRIVAAVLCAAALATPASAQNSMSALVPAYFYPGAEWNALNTAASTVNLTAIMNPNSGVGAAQDANYVAAVANLRAAGGRSIGYVATTYGDRPIAAVLAEITQYNTWYGGASGIGGIFIDEMTNTGTPATLAYYRQIYDHVKAINPTWTLVGNPGATTTESYLNGVSGRTADTLVVFEGSHATYAGYTPSSWNANYAPSNFAHLVYDTATSGQMTADIDLAAARHAGFSYVTDDVLANPWDTLPPYWTAEVMKMAMTPVPEPASVLLVAALGAVGCGWRVRRAGCCKPAASLPR